jgi:membrane protease YdiL (CAAX protease family)
MSTLRTFIKRHPVPAYYALTFTISWGGFFLVSGPGRLSAANWQADPRFLFAVLVTLAGPSVSGLLLTGLVCGRAGFRELRARLLRWRAGAGWYALALLTAPLLTTATLLALSLRAPEFRPGIFVAGNLASLLLTGVASALMVAFLEELGWTGFAIPQLRRRHGALATGLIAGLLWGAWHFPMFWEGDTFSGALPLALLLVRLFAWLPAYRVLMVWAYDRTGSLPVVMLMHASLAATQLILLPVALSEVSTLTSTLVWAAALWLVVAAVAVAGGLKPGARHRGRRAPARGLSW